MRPLPEWHSRGYIPHWEAGETPQFITFRLADSLPRHVIEQCLADLSEEPDNREKMVKRKRFEVALDRGYGAAFLARPDLGEIVQSALLFFDGDRYHLHAWCIMPNHIHVLVTPLSNFSVAGLVQSWKGLTSRQVNTILGSRGPIWYREYFDRKQEASGISRPSATISSRIP